MAVVLEQYSVSVNTTSQELSASATAGNLILGTMSSRWGPSGPVSTLTPPARLTAITPAGESVARIPNMEAHTAALAWRESTGSELGPGDGVTWTLGGSSSCLITGLYEFSGITDPTLDKCEAAGSGSNSVTSIATTSTGTLGASSGVAFLIGLNRLAQTTNSLSNNASMTETYDAGVTGNSTAYNETHAWQEFSTNTAYNVTVSSGTASRMGALVATFIGGGATSHAITASGSGTSGGSAAIGLTLGPVSHAITASGSGTSGGSATLIASLVATASGSGASAGAAAIAATLPTSAAGSGASAGSATIAATLPLSAAGSGASGGSAAIEVATVLPLSATGSGTSGGVVAATWQQAASASGSGVSGGTATLTATLPASAAGAGTSGGAATIAATLPASASGSGVSGGSAAINISVGAVEHPITASGSGASAGAAAIGLSTPLTASGSGVTAGTAVIVATLPASAAGSGASGGAAALTLVALAITQEGFRWRNDDGTEVTATWMAAQDTTVTGVAKGATVGLRILLDGSSDPPAGVPKLQYRLVGNSAWETV